MSFGTFKAGQFCVVRERIESGRRPNISALSAGRPEFSPVIVATERAPFFQEAHWGVAVSEKRRQSACS